MLNLKLLIDTKKILLPTTGDYHWSTMLNTKKRMTWQNSLTVCCTIQKWKTVLFFHHFHTD